MLISSWVFGSSLDFVFRLLKALELSDTGGLLERDRVVVIGHGQAYYEAKIKISHLL